MKKERQNAKVLARHPKPIVPRPLVVLCSASLTFLVLFAAFATVLSSHTTYAHLTDATQREEHTAILTYLTGPFFAENHAAFLTAAEQSHMTDVKRLLDVAFILNMLALGILIGIVLTFAWHKMRDRFDELAGRSLRATGWTILSICFLLGAMSFLNFDRFWILFHVVFFPQGNWAFSPTSVLITLYPGDFFARFVLRWLSYILVFGVAALIMSYVMEHLRMAEHVFTERRK